MKRYLFVMVISLISTLSHASDCVILLHGMGRSATSMNKMESQLESAGYTVWNKSYASTKEPIEDLALTHVQSGVDYCQTQQAESIHVVTHSLGGILIRVYLQDNLIKNLGKVVMLSPPNKGSEVADLLKDWKLYQWLTGPAGQSLGTEKTSIPNTLKAINAPIGIITGQHSSDPWFSVYIPGDDDGKVSVESAKLEEMHDFLVVDAGHTLIMRDSFVIQQTKTFLQEGKFNHTRNR